MMGILQVMKFQFKAERLSFETDWSKVAENMSVSNVLSESDTDRAMREGRLREMLGIASQQAEGGSQQ